MSILSLLKGKDKAAKSIGEFVLDCGVFVSVFAPCVEDTRAVAAYNDSTDGMIIFVSRCCLIDNKRYEPAVLCKMPQTLFKEIIEGVMKVLQNLETNKAARNELCLEFFK